MKEVRINIQSYADRTSIVLALANSGISVRVFEEPKTLGANLFWVIFEVPENNIKTTQIEEYE